MDQHKITSERIDDLPLLIYWLKHMQVDGIIDQVLGPSHGNWEGLSYGEVALVFVAYVLMCCTHFLSPMQEWTSKHWLSLSQALGKPVRDADFTDDRLGVILSRLGDDTTQPGEQIELELGQHMVRAYELPKDTVRIDTTTVSVHHQPRTEDGLMKLGAAKTIGQTCANSSRCWGRSTRSAYRWQRLWCRANKRTIPSMSRLGNGWWL